MFSYPKIAGGGRHHSFSKVLEIKGYEVFRADKICGHEFSVYRFFAEHNPGDSEWQ